MTYRNQGCFEVETNCIQVHVIHFLTANKVSCKNTVRNVSASGSGKQPSRHCLGYRVNGEPIWSWRTTICAQNPKEEQFKNVYK